MVGASGGFELGENNAEGVVLAGDAMVVVGVRGGGPTNSSRSIGLFAENAGVDGNADAAY